MKALLSLENIEKKSLYNLSNIFKKQKKTGTIKYQRSWQLFDLFIVSGNLLNQKSKTHTNKELIHIFKKDFLLEEDKKYLGIKTFRTFVGFKYNNGFSDHLPIYLDIKTKP